MRQHSQFREGLRLGWIYSGSLLSPSSTSSASKPPKWKLERKDISRCATVCSNIQFNFFFLFFSFFSLSSLLNIFGVSYVSFFAFCLLNGSIWSECVCVCVQCSYIENNKNIMAKGKRKENSKREQRIWSQQQQQPFLERRKRSCGRRKRNNQVLCCLYAEPRCCCCCYCDEEVAAEGKRRVFCS